MQTGIGRRQFIAALGATTWLASAQPSRVASAWPQQAVNLIVPATPSGTIDTIARLFVERLSAALKQPVLILNRAGAEGLIGMTALANAKPDGYTFLVNASSFNSGLLLRKNFIDGVNEFAPVIQLSYTRSMLVSPVTAPFKTVRELAEYGKANPGKLNVGSAASATTLTLPPLFDALGIKVTAVNYPGTNQIALAMLSGDVQMAYGGYSAWKPHIESGKLRALAVFSPHRFALAPDVPTISEAFPGADIVEAGIGVSAPKGTPADIVARLNQEFNAILADPAVRERITNLAGGEPKGGTPEDWRKFQEKEVAQYRKAALALNITPR